MAQFGHGSSDEIWASALGELQVQVTRANFDTWLKGTMGLSLAENTFTIGVPSAFAKEWLQKRLSPLIKKTVSKVIGQPAEVCFSVLGTDQDTAPTQDGPLFSAAAATPALDTIREYSPLLPGGPPLNPKYTFSSFIVGSSNRFVHAAAAAVAESPGKSYNPFFVYGGVGLGKTHLLHAIGHRCREDRQKVLYITSEQFTNDFINALRERKTEEFRAKYRAVDVLLIDDIHFIADKEQTQESFFHTFNDLHNASRQIVISSDRSPRSMALLEDRLRSRFEWGLIADIQPPDLEMRLAILGSKAEELHFAVPQDVLNLIAHRFQGNVRELEGALNRVMAYCKVMDCAPTMESASTALAEMLHDPRGSAPAPAQILEAVAEYFRVSLDDLRGPRRSKDLAYARQIAMFVLRKETRLSLAAIGQELGGRDHSTVVHGYEKISAAAERNTALRRTLMELSAVLRAS